MNGSRQLGRWILGAGVLAALTVSGCRQGSSHANSGAASVRLINAVPDAGGLDVSVNGRRVWKRAEFRGSTGYKQVSAGTYPVEIDAGGLGTTLLTQSLSFNKQDTYTLLALGQAGRGGAPARVQVLPDGPALHLPPGKVSLRLINAALGTPAVDLVVNTIVGVKSVGYGHRSAPLLLTGGRYELQIAAPNTARMLAGSVNITLVPGQSYTLIAMGQAGSQSLSLEVYPDK